MTGRPGPGVSGHPSGVEAPATGARLGRVAVTGAGGRLGSAVVDALEQRGAGSAVAWRRPAYDLDALDAAGLLDRDRPSLVVHCAAWTDVDGCARDPALAMRRNGEAVANLAGACSVRGTGLVLISTNEVFDGTRADRTPYAEDDPIGPANAYGRSKLAGERAATTAFGEEPGLWIVRTAWLYGPPGNDFPSKIVAASDRLGSEEALPVVADEWGSPTYTLDLARGLLELVGATDGGVFHLVNEGVASRFAWAQAVLASCRPGRWLRPISQEEFSRPSKPPAWGALDTTRARGAGVPMRGWEDALGDYLATIC
jgi:dTDP-4-dehydrorhamnose reductase